MKKLLVISAMACLVALPQVASARNVWRECGIGGMIFTKTGWAAIVSNIIWDLGTTATSSNVSSDDMCEGPTASAASFIHETYTNLEEEVAVGEGKHLTAMLDMLGCSDQTTIINGLRSDLSNKMSQPSYSTQTRLQKAEGLYNATISRAQAGQCKSI